MQQPRVAVLGAGRIGSAVIAKLAEAGYAVSVFDPRSEARAAAARAGADPRPSPADALARARVVLTALPGSAELDDLMLGAAGGLLPKITADRTWIDLTSTAPLVARRLAAAAQQHGVRYLEAPLGGGPRAARDGALTLYVGGDAAVLAEQRPLLETIADPDAVHYVGPPGCGYTAKLLVNLLWFSAAAAHGEALLLGQAAGLPPEMLHKLFAEGPAASAFNTHYVPRVLAGDYAPGFGLDRIVEELTSLVELSADEHSPFDVSTAVTALYEQALHRFGPADGELLAVAELEARAGRQLRDRQARAIG